LPRPTNQNDTLYGTEAADTIIGLDGDDSLLGLGGTDALYGGAGNDTLVAGTGADTLHGGAGNDVFVVSDPSTLVREALDNGSDTIVASVNFSLPSNVEVLQFYLSGASGPVGVLAGTGNSTANWMIGTDATDDRLSGLGGNDFLEGHGGGDLLLGGTGHDYLVGADGDDTLIGGPGTDSCIGGGGDDLYVLDADEHDSVVEVSIVEAEGGGRDTIRLWSDTPEHPYAYLYLPMPENVEVLRVIGQGGFQVVGNASDNLILGGKGTDEFPAAPERTRCAAAGATTSWPARRDATG
jgi:Ca2+-binding RTX toxin-like protein